MIDGKTDTQIDRKTDTQTTEWREMQLLNYHQNVIRLNLDIGLKTTLPN